MKLKVEFDEEKIALIRALRFQKFNDNQYGIDNYEPFMGSMLFEDMALILGYTDKVIPGTEENFDGPRYQPEVEELFFQLSEWLNCNLIFIEEILHQNCDCGIKVGTYTCQDYKRIWEYKPFGKK